MASDDHAELHAETERRVRALLSGAFEDSTCRAVVLVSILHDEFNAMDDPDDVADLTAALTGMIISRAMEDVLLNPVGSA